MKEATMLTAMATSRRPLGGEGNMERLNIVAMRDASKTLREIGEAPGRLNIVAMRDADTLSSEAGDLKRASLNPLSKAKGEQSPNVVKRASLNPLSEAKEEQSPNVVSESFKRERSCATEKKVVKRQKITPAYMRFAHYKEIGPQARIILQEFVHRHLEIREFESPRDILLNLAENKKFRLLPKILRGLGHILERIEHSYRANLAPGVPLLVQLAQPLLLKQGKSNVLITPGTTTKLVALHKLCSRTDRCLRAYVSRHKGKVATASPKSANAIPNQTSAEASTTSTRVGTVGLTHLAASAAEAVSAPSANFQTTVPQQQLKYYTAQTVPGNQQLIHRSLPTAYAQQLVYQAAAEAIKAPGSQDRDRTITMFTESELMENMQQRHQTQYSFGKQSII